MSEDIQLSVVQIPCADEQFRSPDDQLCRACSVCAQGDVELRGFSLDGDRVCSNSITLRLDALGSTGTRVDVQAIDLTAHKARLAQALAYDRTFAFASPLPLAQRESVDITVSLIPCPAGAFMDIRVPACRPCTLCCAGRFEEAPCAPDADTLCANCTACGPFDLVLQECSRSSDRRCTGALALH